jgi:hypothetical protein
MHALRPALTSSCGFGALLVPSSSIGSSAWMVKPRGQRLPPNEYDSTVVVDRVCPVHWVFTANWTLPFETFWASRHECGSIHGSEP